MVASITPLPHLPIWQCQPSISPRTVNDTTEQLKKLFTRAKSWGVRFDHEPDWKEYWLKEPKERVRELHEDEGERLDAKKRADYAPFFAFVHASGMRWNIEARLAMDRDFLAGRTDQAQAQGQEWC